MDINLFHGMHQQNFIFEYHPAWLLLCLSVGLAFSGLLYSVKHPWSKIINRVLFGLRTFLIFFLCLLLLEPIYRQLKNRIEKPLFLFLYDNSLSVGASLDPIEWESNHKKIIDVQGKLTEQGFKLINQNLDGEEFLGNNFKADNSNIHGGLKSIVNRYEGEKISGVVLISDGLYNGGISPLYGLYNFPIYTLGVGDTTQHMDVAIRDVSYNKIAYQGNSFPIRAEISLKGLSHVSLEVSIRSKGKLLEKKTLTINREPFVMVDFLVPAEEKGIQKIDVVVSEIPGEQNKLNNRSSVFVDVVEGKKKIILLSAFPHPDLKALRATIEKNPNYETVIFIPGISKNTEINPKDFDLAILYQSPDLQGKTKTLAQLILKSETPLLIVLGPQSDLKALAGQNLLLPIPSQNRNFDEVTASVNGNFSPFSLSVETNAMIPQYPPVFVHFGKVTPPLSSSPLLFQKIGSVETGKTLLTVDYQQAKKIGMFFGEGIWRWRLNEFERNESTSSFDELFGKLIQFLSTQEEKRRFQCYPIVQKFSENQEVIFESQVYNEIYESVYGNQISLEIVSEHSEKSRYSYVISPGNKRYSIGGLKEGVYQYNATTLIGQNKEQVRGQFAVVPEQVELYNLTADMSILKKLSNQTGGKFYYLNNLDQAKTDFENLKAVGTIHPEESILPLIHLKFVFWILLAWVTLEWFTRKYSGAY